MKQRAIFQSLASKAFLHSPKRICIKEIAQQETLKRRNVFSRWLLKCMPDMSVYPREQQDRINTVERF
jgi:hypothetical protein